MPSAARNVALVLGLVAGLLRLARAGRRVTIAVLAVSLLVFMVMTRFEPSVVRAGAMAGIGLGGLAIGAARRATGVLGVATVVALAHDPFLLWSVGFHLSVLATLGILELAPRIARVLPEGKLASATAVTLGAQLAVAPLIALHMNQLSLVSLAANLVVAPLVAPATVVGMTGGLLASVWAPASVIALAAAPMLGAMRRLAAALAEVPMASVATPEGALGLVVAAGLAAFGLALARGRSPRAGPIVISLALVLTGGVWARALGEPPLPQGLLVTMLDVGQGDAIVVRSRGATMLVDGGEDGRALLAGLHANGIRRIDLLVMTHPHEDHVAGLVPVARRFPVVRALDPFIEDDLPSYRAYVRALAERRIPRERALAGMRYRLGGALVEVLWPRADHLEGTESDINNNSVVLRVRYGAHSVLLAGETQEEAQQELLDGRTDLRASVLKVSHHGSARMLPAFYRATRAGVALIPVGPNTFGHPAPQTLAALAGMAVLRSDLHGTAHVGLDGSGAAPAVRTERALPAAA